MRIYNRNTIEQKFQHFTQQANDPKLLFEVFRLIQYKIATRPFTLLWNVQPLNKIFYFADRICSFQISLHQIKIVSVELLETYL